MKTVSKTVSYRALTLAIMGTSVAASLLLGPGSPPPHSSGRMVGTQLPATGDLESWVRVRHRSAPAVPTATAVLYVEYVPPPPPPPTPPAGTVTIPVPIYRQAMPLDCETSALRMGLATYGHYYSDAALFAYENPDLRPPVMGANHAVLQWGDPYTNFVGNVWGSEATPTGWGIFYPVIVSIAQSHGLPNAHGGEGLSPGTVYAALSAGHPVEVWVEYHWLRPHLSTWTAWDGRQIRYSLAEHVVILSGVSPTSVRVNDPVDGTQYWVSKSTFETVWRDINDMAVIFQ